MSNTRTTLSFALAIVVFIIFLFIEGVSEALCNSFVVILGIYIARALSNSQSRG